MTKRLPTPTDSDIRRVLDRQVLVMFGLASEALADLTIDECLWTIDERSWTVHRTNGQWVGELDEEPPDLPTPSLAWTMWHPIWWLSVLLAHSRQEQVPEPTSVVWPGPDMSLAAIRSLWQEWVDFLDGLGDDDLQSGNLIAFPYTDDRPLVHTAGWASMELVKNLSEMCQLRRVIRELSCSS